VYEYIRKFNYLTQYGTNHVDTDEMNAKLFGRGLGLPLQDRLVWFHELSLSALVSAAIAQDGTYQVLLAEEEEKRKRVMSRQSKYSTDGAPQVSPTLHSICWQVKSMTSTTAMGSPPTLAADVTTNNYPDSVGAGVSPDTCPISSAHITQCTSAEDCSRKRPVFQRWMCWALCLAI
jgi:hypothetical protein